jgi:hypothetical protein
LNKAENIVKWIKGQRISWLGPWREWRRIGCPRRSSSVGSEKMVRVGDR